MYYFQAEKKDILLNGKSIRWLSNKLEYTPEMLCRIFNRKVSCRKIIAFAIVKRMNVNYEIEDFFDYVEED